MTMTSECHIIPKIVADVKSLLTRNSKEGKLVRWGGLERQVVEDKPRFSFCNNNKAIRR